MKIYVNKHIQIKYTFKTCINFMAQNCKSKLEISIRETFEVDVESWESRMMIFLPNNNN